MVLMQIFDSPDVPRKKPGFTKKIVCGIWYLKCRQKTQARHFSIFLVYL